jgi:hypothetical protein
MWYWVVSAATQVVPGGASWLRVVLPNVRLCWRYQLVLYGTVLSSWSHMVLYGYWQHKMVCQCGLQTYVRGESFVTAYAHTTVLRGVRNR